MNLQNNIQSAFFFEIKRGEESEGLETIKNELAGQYLMSFDLKIPWATHRKYQIFEDKHSDLFARPSATAHRIVLCHVIVDEISNSPARYNQSAIREICTNWFFYSIYSKTYFRKRKYSNSGN